MRFYKGFYHGGSDTEAKVVGITSTEEEPKIIKEVVLTDYETTHGASINFYIERERVASDIRTKGMSDYVEHRFVIEAELPAGEEFYITTKNLSAGNNSHICGYIVYEIR
jgi:hypothetical protein